MDPALSDTARRWKRWKCRLAYAALTICRRLPGSAYRNAAEFGQSTEFSYWVVQCFGRGSPLFATRERLWQQMLPYLGTATGVLGYEFGVANGYATRWWLSHCPLLGKWYGFDTFHGLPSPWRHFPAGAFSVHGSPPDIADPRVAWVVGPVETTFPQQQLQHDDAGSAPPCRRLFLFDMDLYGPTRFVAERLYPHLRDGDVLYYDQAADWDERRVILDEMERPSSPNLTLIGATPKALALQVKAQPV